MQVSLALVSCPVVVQRAFLSSQVRTARSKNSKSDCTEHSNLSVPRTDGFRATNSSSPLAGGLRVSFRLGTRCPPRNRLWDICDSPQRKSASSGICLSTSTFPLASLPSRRWIETPHGWLDASFPAADIKGI